jgi:hypothetical protein
MHHFSKILSGDEYFCLQEYRSILKSCTSPLGKPKLYISRSSKDLLPECDNYVLISAEYIHKKSDKTFEYIKVGQENKLTQYLGDKSYLSNMVPICEFKDLKNSQYTVLAYDLLGFSNSILPFYDKEYAPDVETTTDSVFEFVDWFLEKKWSKILEKYNWIFKSQDEVYFWMLDSTVTVCINILLNNTNGIHPYRIQKFTSIARSFGIDRLLQIKKFICSIIISTRSNEDYYSRIRPFSELVYSL